MCLISQSDPVQPIESITCIPSVAQQECVGDRTDRMDRADRMESMESVTGTGEQRQALLLLLSVFHDDMNDDT